MPLEYNLELPGALVLEGVPEDPEDCYLLQQVQGLDGRDVREQVEPLPDGDGDYLGPASSAGATFVIEGVIVGRDRASYRARERALRAALSASTATWQLAPRGRDGDPEDLVADVRTSSAFRCPDNANGTRRLGPFQVAVRSAAPVLYGEGVHTQTVRPVAETGGLRFPVTFPVNFQASPGIGDAVTNGGDARTWPLLRLYGPITNPVLENLSSGESLVVVGQLLDGQFLEIDPRPQRRSVLLNGGAGASRYSWIDRTASAWWPLYPGTNAIRLRAAEQLGDARLELTWRNAYA